MTGISQIQGFNTNSMYSPDQVSGDILSMRRTDPRHLDLSGKATQGSTQGGFGQMLLDGIGQVNQLQKDHQQLTIQAITDPNSVDAHDITIAEAKANMALSITKNVVDRVLRAYQDIINLR